MNNPNDKNAPALLLSEKTGREQVKTGEVAALSPDNTGEIQAEDNTNRDKTGRFKPGVSGNPSGRPAGAKNLTTHVREGLQKLGAKDAEGNPVPLEEALSQKIIKMALDGDFRMIQLVWYYLDGKPVENVDLTSKGERIFGTVVVTAEEDDRIDSVLGLRKLLPIANKNPKNNADNKLRTDGSRIASDAGGNEIPSGKQSGSPYESGL